MRGAQFVFGSLLKNLGIIPADAGSTGCPARRGAAGRDHPRGCGEHMYTKSKGFNDQGSSPRMRGAPGRPITDPLANRIIPADAGSTRVPDRWCSDTGDHPRGCGEHINWIDANGIIPGSSPRMRGAPGHPVGAMVLEGIIPADAGSTASDR